MTLVEMHVKRSVILADQLGREILSLLEVKGQVLHCVDLYFEGSWLVVTHKWLLSRKLPMFLLRLNEISGGRGNVC